MFIYELTEPSEQNSDNIAIVLHQSVYINIL